MTATGRDNVLPILGKLTTLGQIMLVATVALSLAAILLDFGLHGDPTLVFVVSAAAILGLAWVVGLSTERLGSLTGPQVGGILNASTVTLNPGANVTGNTPNNCDGGSPVAGCVG